MYAEEKTTVLVVEDDADYAEMLVVALGRRLPNVAVDAVGSVAAASRRLSTTAVHAMLLDATLPDGDGLALLPPLRARGQHVPFVLLTADASAATAVRALRAGALDYLVKGAAAVDQVARCLGALLALGGRSATVGPVLVGGSAAMCEVRSRIARCGRSSACVRIEGETGVGKELVARSIHAQSDRNRGPFVAVNCGALPEALAEAELFGHARGAYTGAVGERAGLVEHAASGTLFLDEVEDLPAGIQGKLLRLIQEQEYRPVGSPHAQRADVRVLAASNRDLDRMVDAGRFRRDLFYRLDVLRVSIPPLRDRLADLPDLVEHLLAGCGARGGVVAPGEAHPDEAEMEVLREHDWPGNVRELENVVERARAMAEVMGWRTGWASALADLALRMGSSAPPWVPTVAESPGASARRAELERVLARHRWHRASAAEELGISRVTLWRWMRRHGLLEHE